MVFFSSLSNYMYKTGNIYVRIWILKFEVHMPHLEYVKVHRPDDGCLTYWTWMLFLEHVFFQLLPKVLNVVDSYKGQHPWARKLASLLKSYDLLGGSNSPWGIALFRIKFKYIGTCAYFFLKCIVYVYHAKWEPRFATPILYTGRHQH